jgi:putative endopeptidase
MKYPIKYSFILLSALFIACNSQENEEETLVEIDPLVLHVDSSYSASDDFFMFANNAWFEQNPIKASENYNGIFRTIQDSVNAAVKQICIRSSEAHAAKGTNEQKIGDMFKSGMNTELINELGIEPLQVELNNIDQLNSLADFPKTIAHLNSIGVSPLFYFYIGPDDKNSTLYRSALWQGGLGLGERDYYLSTDERTVNVKNEYVQHIRKMFELLRLDEREASMQANTILKIETDLAKVSKSMEDLRDPYANYNLMAVSSLNQQLGTAFWQDLFNEFGLENMDSVIVSQPVFFKAIAPILNKYSLDEWKSYLKWNLVNEYASYLSSDFADEDFYFFNTILYGVKEQKPRWEIVVDETNEALGELIGQVYVQEYLPKNTKEKLEEIGENIRTVYADHIKKLDWMSEETKVKALNKLAKINMKVGYPDVWKDMSAVEIDSTTYLMNVLHVSEWEFNRMLAKNGKAVNKDEWEMFPQTYNAYYNASFNEIVVPACNIMVPGYEGKMPDDALLYGIIGGSTFGHEITHGFDDEGSLYDENGNLNNWWTEEDRAAFEAKTALIVEQYDAYTVLDSMHLNGDATQGENIADLGGVAMGIEAFKKTDMYKNNVEIGGLDPMQRFFMAYAFAWMVNQRDESLAHRVMTDVHSPAKFRVNGVLSNLPEFYEAFNISEGDPMYRSEDVRVIIW